MKKFLLSLAIVTSSLLSFAADENVNASILKSFTTEFAGASNVNWVTSEKYSKASFVLNGQHVDAFYNHDGSLIAITRNITSLELPLKLQNSMHKDYANYWISELFEVSIDKNIEYYVTLETASTRITLKSSRAVQWNTYKKVSKL